MKEDIARIQNIPTDTAPLAPETIEVAEVLAEPEAKPTEKGSFWSKFSSLKMRESEVKSPPTSQESQNEDHEQIETTTKALDILAEEERLRNIAEAAAQTIIEKDQEKNVVESEPKIITKVTTNFTPTKKELSVAETERLKKREEERAKQEAELLVQQRAKQEEERLEQEVAKKLVEEATKREQERITAEELKKNESGDDLSPEILAAKERARTITVGKVAEIMAAQDRALRQASLEVSKIISEKERLREEIVDIFNEEEQALSHVVELVKKEEEERIEAIKIASAKKRQEIENRATEAEQVATRERAEAVEAQKNAERELAEAEAAELAAIEERKKAEKAKRIEREEVEHANKQAEVAITTALKELDAIQETAKKKIGEIALIQKQARAVDILEIERIASTKDNKVKPILKQE